MFTITFLLDAAIHIASSLFKKIDTKKSNKYEKLYLHRFGSASFPASRIKAKEKECFKDGEGE